ncbi:MAG: glutamate 5-kinase [Zetaproteobacteria bacterium]|nr:glutamate 5-kinase [Zetaproteobacteria bacterium]
MIHSRSDLSQIKRVVVKVGSALLTDEKQGVQMAMVESLVAQIVQLREAGIEVCLVTSGAVSLGRVRLNWTHRPLTVHEKQAAAAVGQPLLMDAYQGAFAQHGFTVAQLLLTKDDLRHRRRYLNARHTSSTLFSAGVIPIVNENDTVVVEEIKFGDNDNLGALVALVIDADLLVLMTDVDGLYSDNPAQNPAAVRVSVIDEITPNVLAMAGDVQSAFGTGGMRSKLQAATVARRGGVGTAIVGGYVPMVLPNLIRGDALGTLILCSGDRQSRRRHWIHDLLQAEGRVFVDEGAEIAIVKQGASLLSVGMVRVEGHFEKGACVEVIGANGVIAKGLCNYHADEMRQLCGLGSEQIEAVLGYVDYESMVHRDNLVCLISQVESA